MPTTKTGPVAIAEEAHLHYGCDEKPGIRRIALGNEHAYVDVAGNTIEDGELLERIKSLAIPPAWTNVWICPSPLAHLQATGKDKKGRKQYIYHPDWILISQQHKFSHMIPFSEALPDLRAQAEVDMRSKSLVRRQVLGTVVWLLDHTYIRIGNEEYARDNDHYGLTTMRSDHVQVRGDTVLFQFVGKGGKVTRVDVFHPRVARTVRKLEDLPGQELFQYLEGGKVYDVTSQDVNDYLKEITGEQISAKDFRTWGGTLLSAVTLYQIGPCQSERQAKRNISQATKAVAEHLKNTPAICKKYYIHPVVPETYEQGILVPHFQSIEDVISEKPEGLSAEEFAVGRLLKEHGPGES